MGPAAVPFRGDGRDATPRFVRDHCAVCASAAAGVAGGQRGRVAGRRRAGARHAVGPRGDVMRADGHGAPLHGVRRRGRRDRLSSDELVRPLARDVVDPEKTRAPESVRRKRGRRQPKMEGGNGVRQEGRSTGGWYQLAFSGFDQLEGRRREGA